MANNWKVEQVLHNGRDVTTDYTNINYTETYDKSGDYSYSSTTDGGSGKWSFENDYQQIKRYGVSKQPTVEMTILRLEEKSFWFNFAIVNDTYEFHLIPN